MATTATSSSESVGIRSKTIRTFCSGEAITFKSLKERVEAVPKEFKAALDKWTKDKADASKSKKKFDEKKPVEPVKPAEAGKK